MILDLVPFPVRFKEMIDAVSPSYAVVLKRKLNLYIAKMLYLLFTLYYSLLPLEGKLHEGRILFLFCFCYL